jgi:hydrogenase expression/formation protein HypC
MCLAVPMKVVELDPPEAVVEQGGVRLTIRADLLDDVKLGEYVLVHAGFAIERLRPEEAEETLRLMTEMAGEIPR